MTWLNNFFHNHPVFTKNELAEFLSKERAGSPRTEDSLISYHRKTGRIIRIRSGLYAVIPQNAEPQDFPVDQYLVAAKVTSDAILAYYTALGFHGKAHSVHEQFTYLAEKPPQPFKFQGCTIRGARFPEILRREGREDFDVVEIERAGATVRVTRLERVLVDVLDRPRLCGSWEDIWRSLESIEFFDLEKVIEYTLLLGNATTSAKVGFFLEQHQTALMVESAHLRALQELRPKRPHYLERCDRRAGRLVKNWNLVVPRPVLERSWAEVT